MIGDVAPAVRGDADYPLVGNYLSGLFEEDDYLFANLETPLTTHEKRRVNKKYCFKLDPDLIREIPRKFVFSIANNHMMDYGEKGLFETIETLKNNGFQFAGAGRNIEEAGKPVIIKHCEYQIGFLAAADQRYKTATESTSGIFPAIPNLLIPRIKELSAKVNLVVVSIHMGMEYIPLPTPVMKNLSTACHEAGADIIFFHHAHCVSGYTLQNNKTTVWGAGNYLFPRDQEFPYKEWFDVAVWQIPFNFSTKQLGVQVKPFHMDASGIPLKPDKKKEEQILSRIEYYSSVIQSGKNLKWHIIRNVLRLSYLRVFISNYLDMMRRTGFKSVVLQMRSSIHELFSRKT